MLPKTVILLTDSIVANQMLKLMPDIFLYEILSNLFLHLLITLSSKFE